MKTKALVCGAVFFVVALAGTGSFAVKKKRTPLRYHRKPLKRSTARGPTKHIPVSIRRALKNGFTAIGGISKYTTRLPMRTHPISAPLH